MKSCKIILTHEIFNGNPCKKMNYQNVYVLIVKDLLGDIFNARKPLYNAVSLFISFLASSSFIVANNLLESSDTCAMSSFHLFRNLKCKVFDKQAVVCEPNKKMNDVAKQLSISLPSTFNLW